MKLLIVLGAGASHECWNGSSPREEQWKPPLVGDLFGGRSSNDFWSVLEKHHGAIVLGADLAPYASIGALNLERQLRGLAVHSDERVRRYFREIPAYLRDLLAQVSVSYTEYPGTYIQLIKRVLADTAHEVAFLVLNYDTLLEKALTHFDTRFQFQTFDDYVAHERGAIVVKPHGSANWVFPFAAAREGVSASGERMAEWSAAVAASNPKPVGDDFIIGGSRYESSIRWWRHVDPLSKDWFLIYPRLTAPLTEKTADDLVCPQAHTDALREFVKDFDKLLVIGTRGLDDDVLGVLGESAAAPKIIQYVSKGDAEEVRAAFQAHVPAFDIPVKDILISNQGFATYLLSSDFEALMKADVRLVRQR